MPETATRDGRRPGLVTKSLLTHSLTDVGASLRIIFRFGAVAQLAERCVRNAQARGSNPLSSISPLQVNPSSRFDPRCRNLISSCRPCIFCRIETLRQRKFLPVELTEG